MHGFSMKWYSLFLYVPVHLSYYMVSNLVRVRGPWTEHPSAFSTKLNISGEIVESYNADPSCHMPASAVALGISSCQPLIHKITIHTSRIVWYGVTVQSQSSFSTS